SHPSAVRGGELVLTQGWMDPLLEKTAFAMADSSLSDIIRTPEALYIIYRNYGEYLQMRSSHILIKSSGPNKLDTTRTRTDKEAIQICRELRKRLEQGESFFELAREYSEDPGSAQNGGDIGWTKRNSLDRGYEKVAFLQEPGQISQPVETRFGWHLIRTVKKKDLSARIRLIRFEMPVDEQDRRKALKAIQEARRQAVAGVELKDLAERFTIHPDGVFKYNKPYMVRKNMLVPDLAARFAKMSPGEITEVMENDAGYYFIKLIEK
ncbi:MAG: peptidylprolyl isomerase, partial [Gemmatimonadota bacterium]|nr:peptidylprolyl isomerase [Gemmatimonadota bacterium]